MREGNVARGADGHGALQVGRGEIDCILLVSGISVGAHLYLKGLCQQVRSSDGATERVEGQGIENVVGGRGDCHFELPTRCE